MCVKQAEGCNILEQDLNPAIMDSLALALPQAESVLFSGIGEPLLHPGLEDMIRSARMHLPVGATIGVQTNGTLLSEQRAVSLVQAGMSKVCVSVDGMETDGQGHGGAPEILRVLSSLSRAKSHATGVLEVGVEFVLMRSNFRQLPAVLELAAAQGASFALLSHVLPYDKAHESECLFDPNTDRSKEIFAQWKQDAAANGLDLRDYHRILWKYNKTEQEAALVEFVRSGIAEAAKDDVFMHLGRLLEWDEVDMSEVEAVLAEAREVAQRTGMLLDEPPLAALFQRRCEFVEDGSAFIAADGEVSPCHFLWHDYSCRMDGGDKTVRRTSFGNALHEPLAAIWNSESFTKFRLEVRQYDYPHCSNCTMAPCSDILAEAVEFERDCYGAEVPCGHCLWCAGGLRCLS